MYRVVPVRDQYAIKVEMIDSYLIGMQQHRVDIDYRAQQLKNSLHGILTRWIKNLHTAATTTDMVECVVNRLIFIRHWADKQTDALCWNIDSGEFLILAELPASDCQFACEQLRSVLRQSLANIVVNYESLGA